MKFLSSSQLSEHRYKTPEGYLVCLDCILSRTGKQQYQMSDLFTDGDDTEVDVDRPFDEVFNEKTLASFENKPFTNEHPSTDVNPNNYNELSVGFVRDIRKGSENGRDVMIGNIVVTDPETIRQIEDGEKTELSCGYDCDIVKDDNGNYKQINIRGNHVALCERGRAGIARIVDSNKVKDGKIIKYKGFTIELLEGYVEPQYAVYDKNGFNMNSHLSSSSDLKTIKQEIDWGYLDDYATKDSVKDGFEQDIVYRGQEYVIVKANNNKYSLWFKRGGNYSPTTKTVNSIEEGVKYMKNYYGKDAIDDSINDVEPRQGESKEDFISRFMSATKSEYPDEKQRLAVAYSYWNKQHNSVEDMGYFIPGRRIPAHNEYSNRISYNDLINTFNKVMKSASDGDVKILIGQLEELKKDYEADINNKAMNYNETKTHYKKYKDIVNKYKNSKISNEFSNAVNNFINYIKDSINDEYVVRKSDIHQPHFLQKAKSLGFDVEETNLEYILRGGNDDMYKNLMKDSVEDSNKDYYQLKEELNSCKTKEDYHKWLQEVKSNDNISVEEMDKLIYFYNNMKDITDSIKDNLSSEVRNWWKKVEEANRTKDWGFDINNNGSDDEDMLMAMFDMISDLKGKDNNLYQEGKRIYNKYSSYSQYKDSIKDKLSGNGEVHFIYQGSKIESNVYNRNDKTPDQIISIAQKYGCTAKPWSNWDWERVKLIGQVGKEENLCKAWHEINPAYSVKELMSLHDSIKDGINLTPTSEPGQDRAIYVMQSDADSNLYFYIGKTYAMKDGEWTYAKYKMNGTTPEQVKQELERNGWHQVNKGPAPIIDSKVKDSKYKYLADPDTDSDIIEQAKKLGLALHNVGKLISIEGESSKFSKLFNMSEEDLDKASKQQMSALKKLADSKVKDDYSGFLGNYGFDLLKSNGDYEYWYYKDREDINNFNKAVQRIRLEYPHLIISSGTSTGRPVIYIQKSKYGVKDSVPTNVAQIAKIAKIAKATIDAKKMKDSPASDIMAEIKKAYPQVQVHAENTYGSSGGNSIKFTFSNVPEDTNNWKKFLSYLLGKYAPKTSSYADVYSMVINNDVNADMKEKILHSKSPVSKEEIKKYFPAGSYAFINFTNNTKSVENNDNLKLFFYRSGGLKSSILLPDVDLNSKYIFIERLGGGYDYIQQLNRSYNTSGRYREGKITYDSVTKDDDVDKFMLEQYKILGKPIGKYKEFVIYQFGNKYHVTKSVGGSIVKTDLNSLQEAKEVINQFTDSVKDAYTYEDFEKDLEKMGIKGHTSSLFKEAKRGKTNLKNVKEISGGWWKEVDVDKVYALASKVDTSDSKPIKDATSNECIEKLKTVSIPEGMQFQYGDMQTTMVQIQNVGKKEVSLNLQTGSSSTKELSNAWGRIWKNGKLIFNEQDAINIVRAHMVEKLRMLQDSKK